MTYNKDENFTRGGVGSMYRLSQSIYGWQIRERTATNEQTIFRGTFKECREKIQEFVDAGYMVIIQTK